MVNDYLSHGCTICNRNTRIEERLQKICNNKIFIRGECPVCGTWLKWVPFKDSCLVQKILLESFAGSEDKYIGE